MRLLGIALGAFVASAIVMLSAPAAKSVEPSRPTLSHVAQRIAHDTPLRVVAFGSSSTEGVGASSRAATYPSQLEAILRAALKGRVEVVNAGIGGQDSDDMAARLPAILALRPDLVIWQTGSNDPLRGVPLDRFVAQTRDGIRAIRQAGADVMLMEPQDCAVLRAHAGSLNYRDALRQIADQMQVPLVRRFDLMHEWLAARLLKPSDLLFHDGLHMTDGGYALLADEVGRQILTLAAQPIPVVAHAGLTSNVR